MRRQTETDRVGDEETVLKTWGRDDETEKGRWRLRRGDSEIRETLAQTQRLGETKTERRRNRDDLYQAGKETLARGKAEPRETEVSGLRLSERQPEAGRHSAGWDCSSVPMDRSEGEGAVTTAACGSGTPSPPPCMLAAQGPTDHPQGPWDSNLL